MKNMKKLLSVSRKLNIKKFQTRIKSQATKFACFMLLSLWLSTLLGCESQTKFDIPYNAKGIAGFLNAVCKSIDAESARVVDPDYDSPAGSSCIASEVEIKLPGKVEQTVDIRFYNQDGSDKVKWLEVIFRDYAKADTYNCQKALVLGIEKALTGKEISEYYLHSYETTYWQARGYEPCTKNIIAEYWISEDLKVEIVMERSFSIEWDLKYKLISGVPKPKD